MQSLSDAELLRAHVGGDAAAFAELLGRHRHRLWAVALGITANPHDAADALQEATVRAFRKAHQFSGRSEVAAWLRRITVNAAMDVLRRRARHQHVPLPEDADVAPETDCPHSSEDVALRNLTVERLLEALALLPADQRTALTLVALRETSVNEASVVLGCAPGTVKSRCARGRAALARHLADLKENV